MLLAGWQVKSPDVRRLSTCWRLTLGRKTRSNRVKVFSVGGREVRMAVSKRWLLRRAILALGTRSSVSPSVTVPLSSYARIPSRAFCALDLSKSASIARGRLCRLSASALIRTNLSQVSWGQGRGRPSSGPKL